jgi:hypothetical protein
VEIARVAAIVGIAVIVEIAATVAIAGDSTAAVPKARPRSNSRS